MAGPFFNGDFFGGGFFGARGGGGDVIKTGTGGIDPGDARPRLRLPVKPTGLVERKKAKSRVDERIEDSREIEAEIAGRLAREFGEENRRIEEPVPVIEMSISEIEFEIGLLLRKKIRKEEDEIMLLLLMAAAAA